MPCAVIEPKRGIFKYCELEKNFGKIFGLRLFGKI
jgi:hypothetical protein